MKSFLLRVGMSAVFLALLFFAMRTHWDSIYLSMRQLSASVFLMAFFIYAVVFLFMSLRLRCLFQGQMIEIGVKESLRLTAIGLFFNNFLPTGAGGDLVKAYVAGRRTQNNLSSVLCILMDRLIGLGVLIGVGSLGGFFLKRSAAWVPTVVLTTSYFLFFLTLVMIAIFSIPTLFRRVAQGISALSPKTARPHLSKFFQAIEGFRRQKKLLLSAVIFSILAQIAFTVLVYVFSREMGLGVSFKALLLILPLVHLSSIVPSLNGLGVREGAFVYVFSGMFGPDKAFLIALLATTTMILWSLAGGVVYWLWTLKEGKV